MNNRLNPQFNIVLLSDSGPIPSFFVRFSDPIKLITDNYATFPYYSADAEKAVLGADLLVVQRWLETPTLRLVEAAKLRGVPIVYETDDNLLNLPKSSSMRMSEELVANLRAVLDSADLVTCSTKALADQTAVYNPNIAVIENYGLSMPAVDVTGRPHLAVVNTDYFKLKRGKRDFFAAIARAIEEYEYRVSFFGSVDAEMLHLRDRFPRSVKVIDGFIDDRAEFVRSLAGHHVNVAVVPLEDTELHLIKSDIKFLDFASLGIPAIYNNARVYEAVRHEVDGYITPDNEEGWFRGLQYFADEANRVRCGQAAREVVQTTRGIAQYADRLAALYTALLSDRQRQELPPVDLDRSGLFWQREDLFFLLNGFKHHVGAKSVIARLIERGALFIEPRMEELALPPQNRPLVQLRQVDALTPISATSTNAPGVLSGRPLSIAWIVPRLIVGGGGHRNIIRCAYHLERLGHQVALYFVDSHDPGNVVRAQVRKHFYPFKGHIGLLEDGFAACDIVFATHWSTVAHAERVKDDVGEIVYFVQDFEPFFYAMGSEYVLAENTYRKGFYAITSGVWCEHFLRNTYGAEADHFQFPIDRTIYFDRKARRLTDRVIFFAKPEMPRRCYEIGVRALRAFHALRPDVEIVFYGSSEKIAVDFPVLQLGMLGGPEDLAKLYNEATIGMAFSTTNPSLVPYEMMACGLPVVDMGRPGNEMNYDGSFALARLANPEPELMALEIAELIANPEELAARSRRGVAFASTFPVEEDVGRRIEGLLLARVRQWSRAGGRAGANSGTTNVVPALA